MAGVLIVSERLGFSCSGRAFSAIVLELESILGDDPLFARRTSQALEVGALAADDLPPADVRRFLSAVATAADRISESAGPPTSWGYGAEYWDDVRQFMPKLREFVAQALDELTAGPQGDVEP